MKRIIFESEAVPMTLVDPRTGIPHRGYGFLRVFGYDFDDAPPMVPNTDRPLLQPKPLSDLRAQAGVGQAIVATPAGQFTDYLQPVVIPESVLGQLPAGARIEWRWRWVGARP